MYSNFRVLLLNTIPGNCFSDFIYLGMLIFIIADFFSHKKWGPFIITVAFSIAFKACDYVLLNQSSSLVIEQFLHMIFLPLVLSFLYTRRS
ncbi:hypothetical protein HDR60_02140 [bacterium]|nr:hypothetical protein [bacterium]